MIAIRHMGLYVDNIDELSKFYMAVFQMLPTCENEQDRNELIDELLGIKDSSIMTTKLVTPFGKKNGQGDMLELVKVMTEIKDPPHLPEECPIFTVGMGHVAFGVNDIYEIIAKIIDNGGSRKTTVKEMKNGNLCCFCTDPEHNWIELIQRKEET